MKTGTAKLVDRLHSFLASKPFRWLVASGCSFCLNLGTTTLLHEWLLVGEDFAFGGGLVVAFLLNFLLCRYYTFDRVSGDLKRQLRGFVLGAMFFRGMEYLLFFLLIRIIFVDYRLIAMGVLVASMILKYYVYKNYVFRS